jgi:hypothetical protein
LRFATVGRETGAWDLLLRSALSVTGAPGSPVGPPCFVEPQGQQGSCERRQSRAPQVRREHAAPLWRVTRRDTWCMQVAASATVFTVHCERRLAPADRYPRPALTRRGRLAGASARPRPARPPATVQAFAVRACMTATRRQRTAAIPATLQGPGPRATSRRVARPRGRWWRVPGRRWRGPRGTACRRGPGGSRRRRGPGSAPRWQHGLAACQAAAAAGKPSVAERTGSGRICTHAATWGACRKLGCRSLAWRHAPRGHTQARRKRGNEPRGRLLR